MSWNLEGKVVAAKYMKEYFAVGVVTNSRVKYGGNVQHTVLLSEDMKEYRYKKGEHILIDNDELLKYDF